MNRLLIFLVAGLAGALIAEKKGRSILAWGFVCFLFPPCVLLLVFLPPALKAGKTRTCPYCSRVVSMKDTVCSYCKKELPIEMVRCSGCGSFVPDKEYCIQCNRKLK